MIAAAANNHLLLHVACFDRCNQLLWIDVGAIEAQIDLVFGDQQAVLETQHLGSDESPANETADVERLQFRERVLLERP